MFKLLIRSKFGLFFLSTLLALIIFCINKSIKWEEINRNILMNLNKKKLKPIIIFWHEHIFAMPWHLPKPSSTLQSPHPDGKVLAYAVRWFSLKPIWGSSNKNSFSGFRNLKRALEKGQFVIITPDGPRGPAHKISNGAITLAKITNSPIIPVVWSTSKKWNVNSWDSMRIPKPFTKGKVVWGNPVWISKSINKLNQEKIRIRLQLTLNNMTKECDKNFDE